MAQNTEAENIYQRIALETFVEINFTADCGHTDAVAIVCDAGNHTGKEAAILCNFGLRIADRGSVFISRHIFAIRSPQSAIRTFPNGPEPQRI